MTSAILESKALDSQITGEPVTKLPYKKVIVKRIIEDEVLLPDYELLEEDGEPLESEWHRCASALMIESTVQLNCAIKLYN